MKTRRRVPVRNLALGAVLLALAIALGCAEANPLPSPFADPVLNAMQVYASSVAPGESESPLMLIGLPEASIEADLVRLSIPEAAYDADLSPAADGSFAEVIGGVPEGAQVVLIPVAVHPETDEEIVGTSLTLTIGGVSRDGDDAEPWVAPSTEAQSGGEPSGHYDGVGAEVPAPADELDNGAWSPTGLEISAPDADGQIELRVPAYGMSAFTLLFVLNDDTGLTSSALSGNDGSVAMTIDAEVGHLLYLFAANPVERTATTETFSVLVPAE